MIDGTPEQLKLQLDPKKSVVETIMQTPYENGRAAWSLLNRVMLQQVPSTSSTLAAVPPAVLFKKSMTCKRINAIFAKEYSTVYKPLKCPA
jgi:hypothetical protein